MPKNSSPRKKVKTLSDILPLSTRELRNLGLLAVVIFISTMLSGIFGPEIREAYVSDDISRFIVLGGFIFIYTFILLIVFAIVIKIFWKKRS